MEQAVLLMAGLGFSIMGLSYLFRAKEWNRWLEQIEQRGAHASFAFGGVNLLMGSFIVAFHPVWHGVPSLLSVLGVIAIVKGASYLLFPNYLPAKAGYIHRSNKPLFQISGVVWVLIAGLFLNEWRIQNDVVWNFEWNTIVLTEEAEGK
jgi:uncharacterized protein YjeT (DUF2065 family)